MQQQQFQNQQAAQMGLTQQQMQARGMMGNQNQFQPGFAMPQPPQPGQAMGVPMQHQLSQNQRLVQNGNPTEVQHMQHPLQNNQPMQNIPRPGLPNRGQQQFTPEENHQINNMARQMLAKLTNEDRVNLHRKLATTLPAAQQQALQAQGYDPVAAYIRNQASHAFANDRQKVLQANGQGAPPPANGAMSAPGRPMSQVSMRAQQQPHPPPTTQQPEHSFGMGNLDQFLGQQQEGLRHQAAGQDVVPASNGQAAAPQMRGTPHQPLQGQFAPNRPMQPPSFPSQPQPQWNGPQNQQPNAHQTARMPMQPATPNFAAMQGQTPHQQPLQGQLGGLSNNNAQRTPQQNPNMPTLNQPMDPPNQAQNVLNQRPSQPTPKQGQQNRLSGQPAAAENTKPNQTQQGQGGGNLPPQFAKLPPKLQQELQRIPVDKRRQFLLNLQNNSQRQKMKAAAEAQNSGNAPNVAQRGAQGPAMGATANQATEPSQASNPQATSTANYSGPQAGGNPFAQTNMMHSQGSQQGPDPSRPMPPRMMPIQLNEVQLRFMDSQPFPPAILNKNNSLGQLPESVKTWRQLKDYVQQRGQSLPPGSINNVVGLQSIHMQQIQNSTANKTRMHQLQVMAQGGMKPGLTGQAPQAPSMIPQQSSQPQLPGTVPPGQFPMPHLPQPTMQEIHAARATLPDNVKGISDNQLRGMIFQRRQQEFLKANQQILNPQQQRMIQRNNILQAQRMNSQQGQLPVGQNQTGQLQQAPRGQPQMPQPAPQQVLPPQAPKQPTEPQGRQSQPNRPNQIPPATQKGNKPITNDDVVEVPDPKTQQQPRSSNMRPGQTPQITQEAFARLPNEQKAQFQARIQEAQMNQRAKLGMASQMSSTQPPAASANQNTGLNAGQGNLRDPAMEALMHEVARNTPRRPIVPMSPKTRHQMVEKLKDKTANLVQRIEQTLPVFLRISKNVDQAKEVLRMVSISLIHAKTRY